MSSEGDAHPLSRSAEVLADAARRSARYVETLDARSVVPPPEALARLGELGGPLPERPSPAEEVLDLLDRVGSPATVATTGGRYFGFVIGGSLPAALGASSLAAAWDQCAGMARVSPVAAALEEVARGWILDALGFPPDGTVGFVTGATMANLSGLAAARHALLERAGWDVESRGLFGAPELDVIVGDEVHVSVQKALGLLGLGRDRFRRVPTDDQGRMRPEAFPALERPSLVCIQAGNVNTGAFDAADEICERARASGSWVHVDGAFGLWAAASPAHAHMTRGLERADSWSVDAHKWLNVPYDSGLVLCRDGESLRGAMRVHAPYLTPDAVPDPTDATPEMSRRARGIEVWAALRALGRAGLVDLIERCCRHARRFAEGLSDAGHEILNDVELNQVLVSFGTDEATERTIRAIQEDGTCWCAGTTWHGRAAMRISVSCWATTDEDVERSLAAMVRLAQRAE